MSTLPLTARTRDLIRPGSAEENRPQRAGWLLRRVIERIRHRIRVRATERALVELSDATLRDLGLHRSEIGRAAREAIDTSRRGWHY